MVLWWLISELRLCSGNAPLFNITQPVLLPHCTHKQSPRSSTSHPAQGKWSGQLLSSRRVCPYGSFSNGRAGFSGLQWTLKRRARGSVTPLIPLDSGSAIMAAATQQMSSLPSGLRICSTVPDILYLPELVFGGLVWILVASTRVSMASFVLMDALVTMPNPLGWVMFVSVFCFVMTFLWLIIFALGGHKNSSAWATADFFYHLIAVIFYLSASVILANETIAMKLLATPGLNIYPLKYYQIDIAAVVFSYVATLLYFIHCILSAVRWKSF